MSTNKQYDKSKSKDITSAVKIIFWLLLTLCTIALAVVKQFKFPEMSWWIVFSPLLMPYALIITYIIVVIIGGALIALLFRKK